MNFRWLIPPLVLILHLMLPPSAARADIVINWVNRATSGFDPLETSIVDFAIKQWERHIVSFGSAANGRNSFDLTVLELPLPSIGNAGPGVEDINGIPLEGTVRLNDGTFAPQRGGFFYDPTPGDASEYYPTGISNYYTAIPGGPAEGKLDFVNVVLHEIGHILGWFPYLLFRDAHGGTDILNYGLGRTAILLGPGLPHSKNIGDQAFALMNSSGDLPTRASNDRRYIAQLDLDVLSGVYGFEVVNVSAPEPSTLLLTGLSLLVGVRCVRRRRAARKAAA